MARASGPSKGCRTCRKRRVKCDEQKPICVRCGKAGFNCEGFTRDMSFVSENDRAKRRSLKQEALRAKAVEIDSPGDQLLTAGSAYKTFASNAINANITTSARLWPELNYCAFKDNIQISFTLGKLFSWDTWSTMWFTWGYNTVEHNINSDALKALSGIYYGRQHHDPSFENDGRVHYSKALRGLRNTLESNGGMSIDVLLAGMTASCYEMIASPTPTEALLHSSGIGKLIELRGPERHCSMFELRILIAMRTAICLKALIDRKRCFLEKEDWKTIPWGLHPEEKTMVECVQDIMCDLPGIVEDYDTLFGTDLPPSTYQLCFENLKTNINHHFKLLSEWRALWEQIYPGICHEQASLNSNSPFSTVLHYQDLKLAHGLMLYNAIYIVLSRIGKLLLGPDYAYQQAATETKFECTNLLLNPPGVTSYDAAIEICRSVEYYTLPPHENSWAFSIVFPLKVASDELRSGSAEQEWLRALIMNLATKSGFLFSTGVLLHGM